MQKKKSWRAHCGGNYLTKEDFPEPENLTIAAAREEEVTPPHGEPEVKWILYFQELSKGLVLNKTQSLFMEELTGSQYPEDWIGVRIQAFCDPTVIFGAKCVGGIRLREPSEDLVEEPIPY